MADEPTPVDPGADTLASSRPDASGALRAFLDGLIRPSGPALIGSVTVAASIIIGSALLVTPDRLAALDPSWFPRGPDRLTHETFRVRRAPAEPLGVAIVGASSLGRAVPRRILAEALEERLGRPVPVRSLTSGGLTLRGSSAVVDAIDQQVGGVIIVGVNPTSLGVRDDHIHHELRAGPVGLESDVLREEAKRAGVRLPRRVGVFAIDASGFLLSSVVHQIDGGHDGGPKVRLAPRALAARLAGKARSVDVALARFLERPERSLDVLARMVERTRWATEARIVLLESFWNPRLEEAVDDAALTAYQDHLRRFAASHDVTYLDLDREAGLADEDFADPIHLLAREASWRRVGDLLADRLAPALRERAAELEAGRDR